MKAQHQRHQISSQPLEIDQWQSFCSSIKQTMTGTEEDKNNVLRKRLLKFFHNFCLQKERYYVPRRQISMKAKNKLQISNNSILLYGIDFLTQSKIEHYFLPFEITIEIYDDSHCSVSFENQEALINSIYQHLSNRGNLTRQQFQVELQKNEQNKLKWIQLTPYYELCFQRAIWYRFLTNNDFQHKSQIGKTAIHQTYLMAKSNFFNEIKNSLSVNSSNPRQNMYSRSRQKKLKNKYKFGNQFENKIKCDCCCFSRKMKKLLQYVSQSQECQHHSKSNKYQFNSKHRINQTKYQFKKTSKAEQNQRKISMQPQRKNNRLLGQAFREQNSLLSKIPQVQSNLFDNRQTEESMIRSLVTQLDKYKFDEDDDVNFEAYINSQSKTDSSKKSSDNKEQQPEYSIFQIDQED